MIEPAPDERLFGDYSPGRFFLELDVTELVPFSYDGMRRGLRSNGIWTASSLQEELESAPRRNPVVS